MDYSKTALLLKLSRGIVLLQKNFDNFQDTVSKNNDDTNYSFKNLNGNITSIQGDIQTLKATFDSQNVTTGTINTKIANLDDKCTKLNNDVQNALNNYITTNDASNAVRDSKIDSNSKDVVNAVNQFTQAMKDFQKDYQVDKANYEQNLNAHISDNVAHLSSDEHKYLNSIPLSLNSLQNSINNSETPTVSQAKVDKAVSDMKDYIKTNYQIDFNDDINKAKTDLLTTLTSSLADLKTTLTGAYTNADNNIISTVNTKLDVNGVNTLISTSSATLTDQLQKYTDNAISRVVDAAGESLDTLNELANALGDDKNFASTVLAKIASVQTGIDNNASAIALSEKNSKAYTDTQLATLQKAVDANTASISSNNKDANTYTDNAIATLKTSVDANAANIVSSSKDANAYSDKNLQAAEDKLNQAISDIKSNTDVTVGDIKNGDLQTLSDAKAYTDAQILAKAASPADVSNAIKDNQMSLTTDNHKYSDDKDLALKNDLTTSLTTIITNGDDSVTATSKAYTDAREVVINAAIDSLSKDIQKNYADADSKIKADSDLVLYNAISSLKDNLTAADSAISAKEDSDITAVNHLVDDVTTSLLAYAKTVDVNTAIATSASAINSNITALQSSVQSLQDGLALVTMDKIKSQVGDMISANNSILTAAYKDADTATLATVNSLIAKLADLYATKTELSAYVTSDQEKLDLADNLKSGNAYTDKAVADLVDSAPDTMNTLKELSTAIQQVQGTDDQSSKTIQAILNQLGGKVNNDDYQKYTTETSNELVDHASRLTNQENQMANHLADKTVHINDQERNAWNARITQDQLDLALTKATDALTTTINAVKSDITNTLSLYEASNDKAIADFKDLYDANITKQFNTGYPDIKTIISTLTSLATDNNTNKTNISSLNDELNKLSNVVTTNSTTEKTDTANLQDQITVLLGSNYSSLTAFRTLAEISDYLSNSLPTAMNGIKDSVTSVSNNLLNNYTTTSNADNKYLSKTDAASTYATSADVQTVSKNLSDLTDTVTGSGENSVNSQLTAVSKSTSDNAKSLSDLTDTVTSNKSVLDISIGTINGTITSNKADADKQLSDLSAKVSSNAGNIDSNKKSLDDLSTKVNANETKLSNATLSSEAIADLSAVSASVLNIPAIDNSGAAIAVKLISLNGSIKFTDNVSGAAIAGVKLGKLDVTLDHAVKFTAAGNDVVDNNGFAAIYALSIDTTGEITVNYTTANYISKDMNIVLDGILVHE